MKLRMELRKRVLLSKIQAAVELEADSMEDMEKLVELSEKLKLQVG